MTLTDAVAGAVAQFFGVPVTDLQKSPHAQTLADLDDAMFSTFRQIKAGTESAQWTTGKWMVAIHRAPAGLWLCSFQTSEPGTYLDAHDLLESRSFRVCDVTETGSIIAEIRQADALMEYLR